MESEPNVDSLKRSRRPLRTQLVKRINELEAELSREEPDRTVVQVKLEMIQKNYEKVGSIDKEIMSIVTRDASDDDQDAESRASLSTKKNIVLQK
jgi:hypothetical protein